jgi:thiol:disulfide interchange protein DsbC
MSATDSAPKWHRSKGAIAVAFAVSVIGGVAFATDRSPETSTIERLKTRLPKTQVSKVDCKVVDGLCEVTAGNNLFYVDRSGRYLVIGRVYDMETRQDLTATRLLEINPDTLVGGAAKANAAPIVATRR